MCPRCGDEVEMKHTGRDTLDTTTTSKTTDSRLGDTLDVVAKNLSVTLCSALAETFATFSTCEDALVMLVNDNSVGKSLKET
jgi:hypothetical protein